MTDSASVSKAVFCDSASCGFFITQRQTSELRPNHPDRSAPLSFHAAGDTSHRCGRPSPTLSLPPA
ncbi:hypothetical protein, partial [Shigella flexneri]|uniref:hypothetical protein n=1 Tax=Shigella flexneri TaxID=623 RepID=UPI001C0A7A97